MRVGLCLMVKNEAALIERCLNSVAPLVDLVLIEDTGSTDDTIEIARNWISCNHIEGDVFEEPWVNFAHNRSVLLQRLRYCSDIDYALMMDADDILVSTENFNPEAWKASLTCDVYDVRLMLGSITYERPQLCRNSGTWHYRGVVHEFLQAPAEFTRGLATGFYIYAGTEGSRAQNPDKYLNDAETICDALEHEADPYMRARYTFYLAQSWKDGGDIVKALDAYLDRARMNGWQEEVFVSFYRAAQLKALLNYPTYDVIGTFMQAYEVCSHRAESLHGAASYCRSQSLWYQAYLLSRFALGIKQPDTGLFVEPWIYSYGLMDEYAVAAFWAGHPSECIAACEWLLDNKFLPNEMRQRVQDNARLARAKLS